MQAGKPDIRALVAGTALLALGGLLLLHALGVVELSFAVFAPVACAEGHLDRAPARRESTPAAARAGRDHQPAERVQSNSDASGCGGDHKREPHQRRIHAESHGDAGAHAAKPAPGGVPAQRMRTRM